MLRTWSSDLDGGRRVLTQQLCFGADHAGKPDKQEAAGGSRSKPWDHFTRLFLGCAAAFFTALLALTSPEERRTVTAVGLCPFGGAVFLARCFDLRVLQNA